MNPNEQGTEELIDNFRDAAEARGRLKQVAVSERSKSKRAARWAAVSKADELLTALETEVLHRLGIRTTPEKVNRAAFIYLAGSKHNRLCFICGGKGGFNGRWLNWVDADGVPLPLIQATNGAPREKVRATVQECDLLCRGCAEKRGTRFTAGGKPDLTGWVG